MKLVVRFTALLIALALIAYSPVSADKDTEGDWAGGWTTWKTAAKGDWAEYSSGSSGNKVRWEVLDAKGGKVKYSRKTFNDKGVEVMGEEKEKDWTGIKLTYKLPYNVKIDWTEEELDLSGTKLKCNVATYKSGETMNALYYCKDVPCGGFVQIMLNGKATNWLSSFQKAGGEAVKETPREPEPEVKSELPRFYATPGNSMLFKITVPGTDARYKLREVLSVTVTETAYFEIQCDENGTPLETAKRMDAKLTKADWDKLYAKPSSTGAKLKVGEEEYLCDVFKTKEGTKEITEWISEGAPIKKTTKDGEKETVVEAIKITMK
jgi:hypothetical protein